MKKKKKAKKAKKNSKAKLDFGGVQKRPLAEFDENTLRVYGRHLTTATTSGTHTGATMIHPCIC